MVTSLLPRSHSDFQGCNRNQNLDLHFLPLLASHFFLGPNAYEIPCPVGVSNSNLIALCTLLDEVKWLNMGQHRWEPAPKLLGKMQAFYLTSWTKIAWLWSGIFDTSSKVKAPERLFIESAFECALQYRYFLFKMGDGLSIKKMWQAILSVTATSLAIKRRRKILCFFPLSIGSVVFLIIWPAFTGCDNIICIYLQHFLGMYHLGI